MKSNPSVHYPIAQRGLADIKNSILLLLAEHKSGLRNADIARALGLESDMKGKQKDYLTYSVLGLLMKEGKVKQTKIEKPSRVIYTLGD